MSRSGVISPPAYLPHRLVVPLGLSQLSLWG